MMNLQPIAFSAAHWCVLIAVLMPIVCAGLAKWPGFGRARRQGGYDNVEPRAWLARQQGWQARANAAQANSWEALPFFIGAIVMAHQLGAAPAKVDILAMLFVTLRAIYIAMYVAGLATVRSVIWAVAFLVNGGILFTGFH